MNHIKAILFLVVLTGSIILSGCDYFKNKKKITETNETAVSSDWNCSNAEKLQEIQMDLKQTYLQKLDRALRESPYPADNNLTNLITQQIQFEMKAINTVSKLPEVTQQLQCQSQLVVKLPDGLQQRAEHAYRIERCATCYRESTLTDLINGNGLVLINDQLLGPFEYQLLQTDQDGIQVQMQAENVLIEGLVLMTEKAVQLDAFEHENQVMDEQNQQRQKQYAEQRELLIQTMQMRQKELHAEQARMVELLNLAWDRFSSEQKNELQQDQSDWFERRNADCKEIAQTGVDRISEQDRESYQQQAKLWDGKMSLLNQDMQYMKCFNQKTMERIIYLNNLLDQEKA